MTRLRRSNTLGSYPDREEFQVERVIVWVEVPPHGIRDTWLERADRMFDEVWQAVPAVVAAAQQESRALFPEYWEARDRSGAAGERLAVRGIWIDPADGSAEYDVAANSDSAPDDSTPPPALPADHSISVSRRPDGSLHARA
jgi:hypothetical protein